MCVCAQLCPVIVYAKIMQVKFGNEMERTRQCMCLCNALSRTHGAFGMLYRLFI